MVGSLEVCIVGLKTSNMGGPKKVIIFWGCKIGFLFDTDKRVLCLPTKTFCNHLENNTGDGF